MAGRPRTPQAVAETTGAVGKNPQRYRGRSSPKVPPLGPPPGYFSDDEAAAWALFADEMPWLAASDRVLLEMASRVRARMFESALSIAAMTELRQCLTAMGATPAARSKVMVPTDDGDEDDPAAEFIN